MDIADLTWQALEQPLVLGLAVLLLMLLLGNPLIHLLFSAGWRLYWQWQRREVRPEPEPWPVRSLVVNVVTFGVAGALAAWRMRSAESPPAESGQVFITALVAFAMAVAGYEPLKNVLRSLGFDLEGLNWGGAKPREPTRYTYP